ncbi:nuclear transport factor 2 family protein [Kineococcus sp. NPDC059986]|jgi:ketosteroid isomerase-like protein|uniref:nuclear transport factor 2 family protein n=1 Tax=Kineococcus sp. NPDC059986 TaxID=3155538 RepID=UPI00344C17A9
MTTDDTATTCTAAVTGAFLQCLATQDADGLGEFFADEVDWFVPGDPRATPWVGVRSRASEVPAYFRQLWSALVPGRSVVTVDAVLADGVEAAVFATFEHVAAPTGRPFRTGVALRLTVTGGRITRLHLHEDTATVAAAFAG